MSKDPLQHLSDPHDKAPFWSLDLRQTLRQQLLNWWQLFGRHDLPWSNANAYGVWISEVMLQQTQVITVKAKYQQWMKTFPTIEALANAPQEQVFQLWEGLGYYSRARNVHKAAKQMQSQHNSQMPSLREDRLNLPGVGPSTASAIGSFAFQQHEAIMDGNVERVWSRWWGNNMPSFDKESEKRQWLWSIAQSAMPSSPEQSRPWTQAMMDLGATICTPKNPKCEQCPWQSSCAALASGNPTQWPVKKKSITKQVEHWHFGYFKNNQRSAWIQLQGPRWTGLWVPAVVEAPNENTVLMSGKTLLTHRIVHWTFSEQLGWPSDKDVVWLTWEEALQKPWPRMLKKAWNALSEHEQETLKNNGACVLE